MLKREEHQPHRLSFCSGQCGRSDVLPTALGRRSPPVRQVGSRRFHVIAIDAALTGAGPVNQTIITMESVHCAAVLTREQMGRKQ